MPFFYFDFEFYGPVNTVKAMLNRSINIHFFLDRLNPLRG